MTRVVYLDQKDFETEMSASAKPQFLGGIHIPIRPISKSNWKPKGGYLSAPLKKFETDICLLARSIPGMKKGMHRGTVVIAPRFLKEKGSRTDLPNLPKSIIDALVTSGIFEDDKDVCPVVLPAVFGEDAVRLYIFSHGE